MPFSQLMLPIFVCPRIAPAQHRLHLLVGPGVEVDTFHARDVRAHAAVDAAAADAHEDADVP